MPSAFVTGASGFVGINLVRHLVSVGYDVTIFHRRSSDLKYLDGLPIRRAEGEIEDAAAVLGATPAAVKLVFHVAGSTSYWKKRDREQWAANVEGTRNVVNAALARRAGRLIFTSSVGAYGLQKRRISEETPSNALAVGVNYLRTKFLAEQEIHAGIKRGLDAVILNPAIILGPYDTHNWARLIRMIAEGTLPGVPPGVGSFCHVRDVVQAHLAAAERGRTGENYILAGEEISYLQAIQIIAEWVGVTPPLRATPLAALRLAAVVKGIQSAFTGGEPSITPEMVKKFSVDVLFSSDKARRELAYRVTPVRQTLEETCEWLAHEHLIQVPGGAEAVAVR